ncbi:BCCT family transporter [Thalassotalea crassostreae]|uniref:BCCT family transporter n=1 Tax=Thalassotalea crassostreae TaxID=1763536 RepID=UPI000837C750|nr:BCCT family transporter [Thalassotalea crassostreae]
MKQRIDKMGFIATIVIILLMTIPLIIDPKASADYMQIAYAYIANNFGFLYIFMASSILILLLWLAFSKYGNIKLGDSTDTPQYSNFSWSGMLFCAGVGAGLLYWCTIEWAFYYQSPPFGVEAMSTEAAKWASSYGIFHWGVSAWAFYCLPTLAIAYPYYVKKVPMLKFSISCHHVLKGKENSPLGRFIDFLFRVALIGGAGSSLGFSTPLIAEGISLLLGIESSFKLEVFVVLVCVGIFATSVYFGLEKGMKRLSQANVWLSFLLLGFILLAGPTVFILKTGINSIGTVIQNFVQMNTWTDPFTESSFVESWTVFYWAWWVAFGPFVGIFVTRISKGRTIKEVILGMLTFGSIGGAIFYIVIGNYSLYQQLTNAVDVISLMNSYGAPTAIITVFEQLPLAKLVIGIFCLVCIIFVATTYDAASYTLASSATEQLPVGEDPHRLHRTFWAITLALLPICLMYVGGFKVAQTAVLVVSLPLLFIYMLMTYSFMASLKFDSNQPSSNEKTLINI